MCVFVCFFSFFIFFITSFPSSAWILRKRRKIERKLYFLKKTERPSLEGLACYISIAFCISFSIKKNTEFLKIAFDLVFFVNIFIISISCFTLRHWHFIRLLLLIKLGLPIGKFVLFCIYKTSVSCFQLLKLERFASITSIFCLERIINLFHFQLILHKNMRSSRFMLEAQLECMRYTTRQICRVAKNISLLFAVGLLIEMRKYFTKRITRMLFLKI